MNSNYLKQWLLWAGLLLLFFLQLGTVSLYAQPQKQMNVAYRVDQNNPDIAAILEQFARYLTSRPDSVYDNPAWNKAEKRHYLGAGLPFDRSSRYLYGGTNAFIFLKHYLPTVLSVEPIGEKYVLRVFFYGENLPPDWAAWNPPCILRLYAAKSGKEWKFENAIQEETRNWKRQTYGPINYVVHPNFDFDKKLAFDAVSFCDSLAAIFDLEDIPSFDYYLTTSEEELARLFNFDYWLSYQTHVIQPEIREIATAKQGVVNRREFAQMIIPQGKNFIVNEGIATYFGGIGNKSYNTVLSDYADYIKDNDSLRFSNIALPRYYKQYAKNPLNVVGGFLAQKVYEKQGADGLLQLVNVGVSAQELFALSEKLLGLKPGELDAWIIGEIRK